jgi:RNA polymerase sigma-70 factor (ECF subfamily)
MEKIQLVYKELIALIRKLSPAYKLVFILLLLIGFIPPGNFKYACGISVGTSKSNLSKARAFLQRYLVKDDKGNILCFTLREDDMDEMSAKGCRKL